MLETHISGPLDAPSIAFLHGFLGNKEDWNETIALLDERFYCLKIDLPGHGSSPFEENIFSSILNTLFHFRKKFDLLVGYSMGGRIALKLKSLFPQGFSKLAVFSAHPGLFDPLERKKRLLDDQKWIEMLKAEPFDYFLEEWYKQRLFSSFRSHPSFHNHVKRRKGQDTQSLTRILDLLSLAKQVPSQIYPQTFFFHGEEDLKFADLYLKLPSFSRVKKVPGCGHVIHLENPTLCAQEIEGVFHDKCHV